eukprot:gene4851-5098_t
MSAAAKAAAKRANMFAKQRFERAVTVKAPAGTAADGGGRWAEQVESTAAAGIAVGKPQAEQSQLVPYVDVVVQHLKANGASPPTGSSTGSSRGRGAKRAAARSLLEAHSAVFQAALDLELQEEWQEAEDRLQSWPVPRLMSEGVALFNLAAAADGGVFRDVLVKFFLPNRPLPFHTFSQGDILLVSTGSPLDDSFEGVVVDFSSRWIRLAVSSTAAGEISAAGRGMTWRLDLFANTVTHQRCSAALLEFAAGPAGQAQQGSEAAGGVPGVDVAQQQEALWRVLAGAIPQGTSIAATASQLPPWVRSPQGRTALAAAKRQVKSLVESGQLNRSQGQAIETALTRTLTLWQGPPGTGKTTTLLRFCEAAVQLLQPRGGQLLAVAASNVAVDNLVTGLMALGVKVVRLGQPVKGSSSSPAGGLWEKMLALEAAAAAEVLGSVPVVAATCVGAGDPVLAGRCFEMVVCDEATQAPEPASLVALANKAQAVVMVGDPQQLPPTVKCRAAEHLGLAISLFHRLQAMGVVPLLLNVQYRMHPALCEFPAREFYKGLLQSWPKPADRPLPRGIAWPNPKVNGPESRTAASIGIDRGRREISSSASNSDDEDDSSISSKSGAGGGGYSYFNTIEAAAIVQCLGHLFKGARLPIAAELSPAQLQELEVKSVDGFQGREKEVVLFSAVRSNRAGRVGFLSDYRRLNVALTRAKRGLIVVGDARTLRFNPVWAHWLQWAQQQGVIVAAADVQGGREALSGATQAETAVVGSS